MDEADFKQAIRLLHVSRAWMGTPIATYDPARKDTLYPMQYTTAHQRPLTTALNDLLKKYPYEPGAT